jgi:hypothetical protein
MKFKWNGNKIILRLEKGEEVIESLKGICKKAGVKAGMILGIGAVDEAVIGTYLPSKKGYDKIEVNGNCEITSLVGNVSLFEGEPFLHTHVTLAMEKGKQLGGHLFSAMVSATFEGVLEPMDQPLERRRVEDLNLNLLDL